MIHKPIYRYRSGTIWSFEHHSCQKHYIYQYQWNSGIFALACYATRILKSTIVGHVSYTRTLATIEVFIHSKHAFAKFSCNSFRFKCWIEIKTNSKIRIVSINFEPSIQNNLRILLIRKPLILQWYPFYRGTHFCIIIFRILCFNTSSIELQAFHLFAKFQTSPVWLCLLIGICVFCVALHKNSFSALSHLKIAVWNIFNSLIFNMSIFKFIQHCRFYV